MTDFLRDLRRDLIEAAEREVRTPLIRRLRVPWRPVFAVAGSAAAAVLVLTVAATLSTEAERDVAPAAAGVQSCTVPEGVPPTLRENFGVFRRERMPADALEANVTPPGVGAESSRRVAAFEDGAAYVMPGETCQDGKPEAVCLYVVVKAAMDLPITCVPIKEAILGLLQVRRGDGSKLTAFQVVPDEVETVRFGTGAGAIELSPRDSAVVAPIGTLDPKDVGEVAFHYRGKAPGEFVATDAIQRADDPSGGKPVAGVEPAKEPSTDPCNGGPTAPPVEGKMPHELTSMLGVLRRPSSDQDIVAEPFVPGPQAISLYENGARFIRRAGDRVLYGIAAEIVVREKVDKRRGDACRPPDGPGVPGICLLVGEDTPKGGAIGACYSAQEIREADGFLDYSEVTSGTASVAGLAPDGVTAAVFDVEGTKHALRVDNNVYQGEFPATKKQLYQATVSFTR